MTTWQRKKLITTYQAMLLELAPYFAMRLSRHNRRSLKALSDLLTEAKATMVYGK